MLNKTNPNKSINSRFQNKFSINKWQILFSDKKVFMVSLFFILAFHTIAFSQIVKAEYAKDQLTRAGQYAQKNTNSAVTGADHPILFTTDRNGNNDIYKMSADGSSVVPLATNPNLSESDGRWSPNGTKILFSSFINNNTNLRVMNSDGSNQTLVSDFSGSHRIMGWSPSGQKILYTLRDANGIEQLWVMDSDGNNKTSLTNPTMRVLRAEFSPDETKIAYSFCGLNDFLCDIFTMNADGTNQVNLTNNGSASDEDVPHWSNDGTRITYTFVEFDGNMDVTAANVAIMNADGTNKQNLTNDTAAGAVTFITANGRAISPDGTKIASNSRLKVFTTSEELLNSFEVYTVGLDGNNQFNVTNNNVRDSFSTWSADSSKIVFDSRRDTPSTTEIYVMNADGTGVVRLTNNAFNDFATDWQNVPDCFYTISTDYLNIPAASGTGSFDLSTTSNCSWNATTTSSWITVTNNSGTDDAAIDFTVDPNPGVPRYGTIDVNGTIFTILQQEDSLGQNFVVNKMADTSDGVCDIDCSLREAIVAANERSGDDTISFDNFLFGSAQTITLSGSQLRIENAGALTINGTGAGLLTIDGNNDSRVVFVEENVTATLNGLRITKGNGVGSNQIGGGGIYNFNGNLTINNSIIDNNEPDEYGGGGIYARGSNTTGSVTINNSVISNNAGFYGGAIFFEVGGTLAINNSRIENNQSISSGGGIDAFTGGGPAFTGTNIIIQNSAITGNTTDNFGGGINLDSKSLLTLTSSTVNANSTNGFGGGGITHFSDQLVSISNSTISGNTASGWGGGIFGGGGELNISSSTITNNTADSNNDGTGLGGGIDNSFSSGAIILRDSIVANNFDKSNSAPDVSGVFTSQGFNLIEDTTGGTINGDTATNITGVNPQLLPLGDYGGTTKTHALTLTSPAVDKGKLPDPLGAATDQRGETRPFDFPSIPNAAGGDGSDIGAFERQNVDVTSRTKYDFDGDGRADISVFRSNEGNWYINSSTDGFYGINWGLASDKLTPADFDGDGKTDVAVWRESENKFYILQTTDGAVRTEEFGIAGDIPTVVGDWDGDGKADIAVYREAAQSVFYYRGSNNNPNGDITFLPFGITGDIPVRGDYDGDGKLDVAVFRPSNKVWYIRQSSDNVVRFVNWGLATDKLVPADYDGDGKTDIAIYRDGVWYILQSSDNQARIASFGLANDIPVPADYDGDGEDDIAIYRDGVWYVSQSTNGNAAITSFGLSSDTPVPSVSQP